ncbi:peroxiredoxin family protein [Candidatus Omnitrophota bacterium]
MKQKLSIVLSSFLLFALFAGCAGCAAQEAGSGKAPDFTLNNIHGEPISLSDFKGNVVIIDFFASWCPPCKQEIPDFIELSKEYGAQGFTMIGISLEALSPTRKFAEKKNIDYQLLIDDGKVSKAYGPIRSIPTTFVLDRKGNIVNQYIGYRQKSVFEKDIVDLLKIEEEEAAKLQDAEDETATDLY